MFRLFPIQKFVHAKRAGKKNVFGFDGVRNSNLLFDRKGTDGDAVHIKTFAVHFSLSTFRHHNCSLANYNSFEFTLLRVHFFPN